jgi:hypothetical protein
LVGAANFEGRARSAIQDNGDACILRDFAEENVAADPPRSARFRCEGSSALKRRQSKGKSWYENDSANGPRCEVVVQDNKVWSTIFEDGSLHFRISGVDILRQRVSIDFSAEMSIYILDIESRSRQRCERLAPVAEIHMMNRRNLTNPRIRFRPERVGTRSCTFPD